MAISSTVSESFRYTYLARTPSPLPCFLSAAYAHLCVKERESDKFGGKTLKQQNAHLTFSQGADLTMPAKRVADYLGQGVVNITARTLPSAHVE